MESRNGQVTREDVARSAGVSKTTVTYVLNQPPGVSISEATRRRVLDAASALGYRRNFAATSLATGRTEIVGLLLPDHERILLRYYSRMIAGISDAAHDTPYNFLYLSQDRPDKYLACMERGLLDGMLVLQPHSGDGHVRAVQGGGIPVVTINFLSSIADVPAVSADYEGAVTQAVDLLRTQGRRRIVWFYPDKPIQPNRRSLQVFPRLSRDGLERLEHVDLPSDPREVRLCIEDAVASGRYDGVIVEQPTNARLVVAAARRAGRSVSADLDVVAVNLAATPEEYPDRVLVLGVDASEIGAAAWRAMESRLAGRAADRSVELIPFRLVHDPG